MRALAFHRPGKVEVNDVPDPRIEQDDDLILRVTATAIFDKGIHLSFDQAPVQKYIDELIRLLDDKKIRLNDIITHRLPLSDAPHGYEIFSEKKDACVKVVLKP